MFFKFRIGSLVSFILLMLTVLTCRDSKGKQVNSSNTETVSEIIVVEDSSLVENYFYQVEMHLKVLKDDRFHVFYQTYEEMNFSGDRVIEHEILGSDKSQKIKFNLPEDIIPIKLRFDFGTNYHQEPIEYEQIVIRYQNKEYQLDFNKFKQLFRPNKFAKLNELKNSIETSPISGKYDPNFVSIPIEEIVFELMDYE